MENQKTIRRSRIGRVIETKSEKTVKVQVEGIVQHKQYKKYMKRHTRFLVHDPMSVGQVGDIVRVEETRPISKNKFWVLCEVVKPAGESVDVDVEKEVADDSAGINP